MKKQVAYTLLFFSALFVFTKCMHIPQGFHPNWSAPFQDWIGSEKPDTIWINDIFMVAATGKGPKKRESVSFSRKKVEQQILASLDWAHGFEIVVSPNLRIIDIEQESICAILVFKKDSCSYLNNLRSYIETEANYEDDKHYLIPSYFLKSTWFKVSEAGAGAGTVAYFGEQRHYRLLQLEVPVFFNNKLVYNDSNYYADSLTINESKIDEELFDIDQVIFDSLMYYSFDDKVEPLKLK